MAVFYGWELLRKHATFFRVHFTCFVMAAFIMSFILWCIGSERGGHFAYLDCFYGVTSALCLSGLTTVPVEDIPPGGQVVLMLAMILGSQMIASSIPLFVKKHRYCRVAKAAIRPNTEDPQVLAFSRSDPVVEMKHPESLFRRGSKVLEKIGGTFKASKDEIWMAEMATQEVDIKEVFQEHQATIVLIHIIYMYFVIVQLVGFFIAWLSIALGNPHSRNIIRGKNTNLGFFSLFGVVSAFANVGYIAANENMAPFSSSVVLLLDFTFLILLGGGLYPLCLRGIISLLHRYSKNSTKREVYRFLLDHPRKCYTHLFPPKTTMWLLVSVVGLNCFEMLVLWILDWNSDAFAGLDALEKIVNGLFQCTNTRSGGMNSVNLTGLSPTTLFIFAVMMYISAYPVFLSRQVTRHKEAEEETSISHLPPHKQRDILDTNLSTQFRRLLAQDLSYLFLATFSICVSVNRDLKHDPLNYNIFTVLFEIISAYGGVGLSYGYSCSLRLQPGECVDKPVSFSGKWGVVGKLVMIVVMFLGRHRGLPDNIDSAILLPEQKFSKVMRRQSEE